MTLLPRLPDPAEIIRLGCRLLEIPVTSEAVSKMMRHIELLVEWSSRVNLTALKMFTKLPFYISLIPLLFSKFIPLESALSVLDVGSGAGSRASSCAQPKNPLI